MHLPRSLLAAGVLTAGSAACAAQPVATPLIPLVDMERGTPATLTWESVSRTYEGGTWHSAKTTRLHSNGKELILARPQGSVVPIYEHLETVDDGRYLLLGWSSMGAGSQTNHALLVDARSGTPKPVDALEARTQRGKAMMFLRRIEGRLQLGIPRQPDEDWEWSVRAEAVDLGLRGPPPALEPVDPTDPTLRVYDPPFHFEEGRAETVVWIELTAEGFRQPAPEATREAPP